MATSQGAVTVLNCVLKDLWAGNDNPMMELGALKATSLTATIHHNVETAAYPIGSRFHGVNKSTNKPFTVIYLAFETPSGVAYAAGAILSMAGTASNTTSNPFTCNNDPDDKFYAAGVGPGALALGAMTTNYFGFALCGGFVPTDDEWGLSSLEAASVDTFWDKGTVTAIPINCAIGDQTADENALVPAATAGYDTFIHLLAATSAD